MSNLTTSSTEPGGPVHSQPEKNHQGPDVVGHLAGVFLERSDSLVYAIVGICFFLGAIFALGYSFWDFGSTIFNVQALVAASQRTADATTAQAVVANAIIKLVSDLLLVLIIMEVLGTVIHYLKSHATSLRPFLFIGIISATRGVLSIGARLSVETVSGDAFYHAMIELGANALAILALGITLKLLGKIADEH